MVNELPNKYFSYYKCLHKDDQPLFIQKIVRRNTIVIWCFQRNGLMGFFKQLVEVVFGGANDNRNATTTSLNIQPKALVVNSSNLIKGIFLCLFS